MYQFKLTHKVFSSGFSLVFLQSIIFTCLLATIPAFGQDIRPYSANQHYFEYQGQPIMLLGSSSDDNMFQITGATLRTELDAIVDAGGNYLRNTMSSRSDNGFEVKAYKKVSGKYDLNQWNTTFWDRFEYYLQQTQQRGIIVQIEVWATWDFYDPSASKQRWQDNPFNPALNSNYTTSNTNLENEWPYKPSQNLNPFFDSVPSQDNDVVVLNYQQAFVDKVLSYTLQYDHVLYVMDNETAASKNWTRYWIDYIQNAAGNQGRTVYTSEMIAEHDPTHSDFNFMYNDPSRFSFIETAQNSHTSSETHYVQALGARTNVVNSSQIRPITNTKIYGASGDPWGYGEDEGLASFWRSLFAGHASARFHRPHWGLGETNVSYNHMESADKLFSQFDVFNSVPNNNLLSSRSNNEAFALANAGEEYAVYFVNGGNVNLNVSAVPSGTDMTVNWLKLSTSVWSTPIPVVSDGNTLNLNVPGSGHWAVYVQVNGGGSTAATPVISPAGGSFSGSVEVSLSTSTEAGSIYYTTNGSTPSTSSTLYSTPITLSATTTVKAITTHATLENSQVESKTFTKIGDPPPSPWVSTDVGNVGVAGVASYDAGTFTISGAGADIWSTDDSFQFLYQPFTGDVELIARIVSQENTHQWAKAGVMIRETTASGSKHGMMVVSPENGISFQRRTSTDQSSVSTALAVGGAPRWLRLVRQGNVLRAYYSSDGTAWTFVDEETISMASQVEVGLAVLSHENNTLGTSVFESVSVQSLATEVVNTPVISPSGGTYLDEVEVSISVSTSGASIRYTTDGSTPTEASILYTSPFTLIAATESDDFTVRARGFKAAFDPSSVAQEDYIIEQSVSGTVETPVISPGGGTFTGTVIVTLSSATPDAIIRYTVDGTDPTPTSTEYATAITLTESVTLKTRGYKLGMNSSAVSQESYTISESGTVATPIISPAGGTFTDQVSVTITTATPGATIRYTLDGSTPTGSSALYASPILLSAGENTTNYTVRAGAFKSALNDSQVSSESYIVEKTVIAPVSTPVALPAGGTFTEQVSVTLSVATAGASIRYTVDGSDPNSSSTLYTGSLILRRSELGENVTLKIKGFKSGVPESLINTYAFVLEQGTIITPVLSPTGGTFTSQVSVSISSATAGATIRYTTDGSTPTGSSTIYNSPILLEEDGSTVVTTLKARAFKTDNITSGTITGIFTVEPEDAAVVATPLADPTGGSFEEQVSVSLTVATDGASIRFTTDGTTPNASSTLYSGDILLTRAALGEDVVLKTIGLADGLTDSPIATYNYTLTESSGAETVANPLVSPTDGTYEEQVLVSITVATEGAAIYYTFDGSEPTIASNLYTNTITLSRDDQGENVEMKVKGIKSGATSSATSTHNYTLTDADAGQGKAIPVISPAGGTFQDPVQVTLTSNASGAIIRFTTDGTTPKVSSPTYSGPFTISESATLKSRSYIPGQSASGISQVAFVIGGDGENVVATPSISPGSGTYTNRVTVTISVSTPNAQIRYTLDGGTPNSSSPIYTGAIDLTQSATVRAIAFRSGYSPSAEVLRNYTIDHDGSDVASTPVISPADQSFVGSLVVSMNTDTPNAQIWYTTNNTDPLDAGTPIEDAQLYDGPFVIINSLTIRARTVKPGFTYSNERIAVFTNLGGDLPENWASADIGAVGAEGESGYNLNGNFVSRGAGSGIGGSSDAFHFVYRKLSGDGEIVAKVVSMESDADNARAGIMMRASLGAGAQFVGMFLRPNGGALYQRREGQGGLTEEEEANDGFAPYWIRLRREGTQIRGYISENGSNWLQVSVRDLHITRDVFVGIAVTSDNESDLNTVIFSDVEVSDALAGANETTEWFQLVPAYPNPFNPTAVFSLQVFNPQRVNIEVFNVLGQRVLQLHDDLLLGGKIYNFTIDASGLPAGLYFYRATGLAFSFTRKVILLK